MSHGNFMSAIFSIGTTFTSNEKDIFLAYLPLAHIFELIVGKDSKSNNQNINLIRLTYLKRNRTRVLFTQWHTHCVLFAFDYDGQVE